MQPGRCRRGAGGRRRARHPRASRGARGGACGEGARPRDGTAGAGPDGHRSSWGRRADDRRSRGPPTAQERDLATLPFAADALVVVLDGITDPQNLGAAARTAEAAGAAAFVTRDRRAAGVTPAAVRASAGALQHLSHAVVANIARALARLQEAGFTVVGLDDAAPRTIFEERCPDGRIAIVIGSEGRACPTRPRTCNLLVTLRVRGRVGSLKTWRHSPPGSTASSCRAVSLPRLGPLAPRGEPRGAAPTDDVGHPRHLHRPNGPFGVPTPQPTPAPPNDREP